MFRNGNAAITLSVALNVVIKKLQTQEKEKRLARVLSSKNTILHALALSLYTSIQTIKALDTCCAFLKGS
jgi:hypothetical protein